MPKAKQIQNTSERVSLKGDKKTSVHKFTIAQQQALLASIVNFSEDAILCQTMDGIITTWNNGAEKVYGYTAEEIIGRHISILIPAPSGRRQ